MLGYVVVHVVIICSDFKKLSNDKPVQLFCFDTVRGWNNLVVDLRTVDFRYFI